jgi:hypothetical protein
MLKSTIVAGNRDLTGDGPDCWGPFGSQGHNLIQNLFDCSFSGDTASDIVGQDARLGALEDNGGPTLTHALVTDSPALDRIDRAACTDNDGQRVHDDQRGVRRPQGPACDIGAFERDQAAQ